MTEMVKFKVSPSSGSIGLYRDPDGTDAALTDPLNNLELTIFHPALRYPGVVQVLSGTLSLAAGPPSSPAPVRKSDHVLAAHGQAGRPMVMGKLSFGSETVHWAGTVPVQQYYLPPSSFPAWANKPGGWARWLTLGADDTNIICVELCNGEASALPAMTVDWEVLIFDRNLDEDLPEGDTLVFRNTEGPVEIITPKGTFSTAKRYLRLDASGFAAAFGKTTQIRWNGTVGGSIYNICTWRWTLGSGEYTQFFEELLVTSGGTPTAISRPVSAFTPDVKTVTV